MYRVLLVHTPSYKDKRYLQIKETYNDNIKEFHKRYTKLKTEKSDTFYIQLIGYDGTVKKEYKSLNVKRVFNAIDSMPLSNVKGTNLSLYSDYSKNKVTGLGFKDKEKAIYTINKIKNRSKKYQMSTILTMRGRAMNHPHQTKEMRDAIKVFDAWLKENKS